MPEIIAIANQKGGVGKTTVSTALAAALQSDGYRVLLIDCDAQGNASDSYNATSDDVCTLYDILTKQGTATEAIQHQPAGDIIPADPALSSLDNLLNNELNKHYRLKEGIADVVDLYDYILLDTPPQLNLCLFNALAAASSVIIPITADRYALAGLSQLSQTIADVKKYINPKLTIRGLLLNQYRPRELLSRDVIDQIPDIAAAMGTELLPIKIRPSISVRKAQAARHSLFMGESARSTTAEDFKTLANYIEKGATCYEKGQ